MPEVVASNRAEGHYMPKVVASGALGGHHLPEVVALSVFECGTYSTGGRGCSSACAIRVNSRQSRTTKTAEPAKANQNGAVTP